jgi:hypothetical protein
MIEIASPIHSKVRKKQHFENGTKFKMEMENERETMRAANSCGTCQGHRK